MAEPHIQALLELPLRGPVPGARPPVRGLDRSRSVGIGPQMSGDGCDRTDGSPTPAQAAEQCAESFRRSPRRQLPDVAEAQARYGVALVLAQEQNLGRQYLQNALRSGNLDHQYQLWAAWTILQAGYPEEAEPIVQSACSSRSTWVSCRATSRGPSTCCGARSTRPPESRRLEEGGRGVRQGPRRRGGGVADGDHEAGADRCTVRPGTTGLWRGSSRCGTGQGGPAAEQLVVLTLEEQGKKAEARHRSDPGDAYPKVLRARGPRGGPPGSQGWQTEPEADRTARGIPPHKARQLPTS